MMISSLQNPQIKAVVKLHQRKFREKERLILIEGRHPVEEAIRANLVIEEWYIRAGEHFPQENLPCPPVEVTEAVMAKISTTDTPPPVLAIARTPEYAVEPFFQAATGLILGLVDLQDPGNFGSLIRSACAFDVTHMITIGSLPDPYHPKVIRASTGLVFRLPIGHIENLETLCHYAKAAPDLQIWGTNAHRGISYREATYSSRTLLLMGGEAHGLPEATWNLAEPLHIPMSSMAESLNVGVAGAIILSEVYQQRRGCR